MLADAGAAPESGPGLSRGRRALPGTEAWILLALTLLAVLSRIYTTNSLAGEPTSDEYFFALFARDLARGWSSGGGLSLAVLADDGRALALQVAALSFVLPWDQITVGRTLQAAFNAFCVPLTYVLGRQAGLRRTAALVGALLLLAAPEFQEFAWRFWSDSQATFLALAYLSLLLGFARAPGVLGALGALVLLVLLFLTKDSAAALLAPFFPIAIAAAATQRPRSARARVGLVAVLMLPALLFGAVSAFAPGWLDRFGGASFGRVLLYGPRVMEGALDAMPLAPEFGRRVVQVVGPFEIGVGLLWAWALGYVWLLLTTAWVAVQASTGQVRRSTAVPWLVALLAWTPISVIPFRRIGSLGMPDPWVALAAGALLVGVGLAARGSDRTARTGWSLAALGTVTVGFLAQRLVVWATPDLQAAFTIRTFMPLIPLWALLAGAGVWGAAASVTFLLPTTRHARSAMALLAAALLVGVWSPLVSDRLSTRPLLARRADRGADPETPQGLRVEALVEAEAWLRANLRPSDQIATGIPRHLAWYADLGVAGLGSLVNLGAQARPPSEQDAFIRGQVGPTGAHYVVDFNVYWTNPDDPRSRQFRETFDWLAGQPSLEVALLRRDRFGHPALYVIRNHGYGLARGKQG